MAKQLDSLIKILSVALIPIAIAVSPAVFNWASKDRKVDSIIINNAFTILAASPNNKEAAEFKEWARKIVEKYSNEKFSEKEKIALKSSGLPIAPVSLEALGILGEPCPVFKFEAGKVMPQVADIAVEYALCSSKVEALLEIFATPK